MTGRKELRVGVCSQLELGIRFAFWMESQPECTVERVMRVWEVSRSTAYRWLAAYHTCQDLRAARPRLHEQTDRAGHHFTH